MGRGAIMNQRRDERAVARAAGDASATGSAPGADPLPDGAVATQFGVRRRFIKLSPTKRATFVIGSDLRVLGVIQSEVRMNLHADKALEVLKARVG